MEWAISPKLSELNWSRNQDFQVNNSNEINEKLIFKSGIQADLRKIESNDRGNHSDYHFGAYLMGVYKSNNLVLTTIAREDYDENYGFEFCPQIIWDLAIVSQ